MLSYYFLGATHKSEINSCVMKLVSESEDPLVIPFLLNLSSMSDFMASTVINVSSELINEVMAEKIANLLPIWYAKDIILSKVNF